MERNPYLERGKIHLWCHWCGVRSVIIDPTIIRGGEIMSSKEYQTDTLEKADEFARKRR
jgi:hypothetical protein